MRIKHHAPETDDLATAISSATDELRSMRTHGVHTASLTPEWESRRNRRLARIPLPSRTLGGC